MSKVMSERHNGSRRAVCRIESDYPPCFSSCFTERRSWSKNLVTTAFYYSNRFLSCVVFFRKVIWFYAVFKGKCSQKCSQKCSHVKAYSSRLKALLCPVLFRKNPPAFLQGVNTGSYLIYSRDPLRPLSCVLSIRP